MLEPLALAEGFRWILDELFLGHAQYLDTGMIEEVMFFFLQLGS